MVSFEKKSISLKGGYRKRNELGGAQRHRRAAIHPFFCARRKRETKIPKPIQSRCRETIRKQGDFRAGEFCVTAAAAFGSGGGRRSRRWGPA